VSLQNINSGLISEEEYDKIRDTPTDVVDLRDVYLEGTPIYDDNTKDGNQVYSSTLSILNGVRSAILKHAQVHFDRSLQYGVLSMSSDTETDLRQFRKANKSGGEIVLPSFALSLKDYSPFYSPSYNTRRYKCYMYDKGNRMLSYTCIPIKFSLEFRYYCTTYDMLLRFRENLNYNSQINFPIDGFVYKVFADEGIESYMAGHIYFRVNDKDMKMSSITLKEYDENRPCVLTVGVDVWANILSKPYLTNIIKNIRASINLGGASKKITIKS